MEHIVINKKSYIIFRAPFAQYFPALVKRGNPLRWFAFTDDHNERDIVCCFKTKKQCLKALEEIGDGN
jgi:hypothetical protein